MQANKTDKYIPKTGELVHITENMQWDPSRLSAFIKSRSVLRHSAQWCKATSLPEVDEE